MEKVVGAILLVIGLIAVGYGFVYMNSAQHQMLDALSQMTGGHADPMGWIWVAGGGLSSILGLVVLVSPATLNGSGKKVSSNAIMAVGFVAMVIFIALLFVYGGGFFTNEKKVDINVSAPSSSTH